MTLKFTAALAALCCTLMAQPASQPAETTTASGLKILEFGGEVPTAESGDTVYVHYTGILQSTGSKFDSSYDHPDHQPIKFKLGAGEVIKGWDEGIIGMKVGDRRKLIIPPSLAYGERGSGDSTIPPNATLVFQVELVRVDHAKS